MIEYLYLGRVGYDDALRLQAELVDLRYRGRMENTFCCCWSIRRF